MKTLAKLYRSQYRAIEDAIETWKTDPCEARSTYPLEEIIRGCLSIDTKATAVVNATWRAVAEGQIRDTDIAGHFVHGMLESRTMTWAFLAQVVRLCVVAKRSVQGADEVATAQDEARKDFALFTQRWKFTDMDRLAEASDRIAAGVFTSGEELLRGMQGHESR